MFVGLEQDVQVVFGPGEVAAGGAFDFIAAWRHAAVAPGAVDCRERDGVRVVPLGRRERRLDGGQDVEEPGALAGRFGQEALVPLPPGVALD